MIDVPRTATLKQGRVLKKRLLLLAVWFTACAHAASPPTASPLGPHLSVGRANQQRGLEANDKVNLKDAKKQIHGTACKAAICEKRDPNGWMECSAESFKKLIFDGDSLDSAALHSLPQNRRGALVVRNHGQNQRAVIALGELCPVQYNHKFGAIVGDELQPVRSQIFDGK